MLYSGTTVAFSTTNARITSGANNGVAKIAQVHGSRKHLGVANQDYMLEYEILLNTDNHCIRIELINSRTDTSVQTDDFFAVIPTLATNTPKPANSGGIFNELKSPIINVVNQALTKC